MWILLAAHDWGQRGHVTSLCPSHDQCVLLPHREGSDDAVILSNDRGLCSLLPAIKERFPDNLITISAAPKVSIHTPHT